MSYVTIFRYVFAPNKTIVKLKKTTKYKHGKIEKYYRCNNKQRRIKDGEGWRRLTWIANDELEKFRLKFSRSTKRDVAPQQMLCNAIMAVSFLRFFQRFVNAMVYYGVSFSTSTIGGDMYLNFFLTSIIEFPANFVAIWIMGR